MGRDPHIRITVHKWSEGKEVDEVLEQPDRWSVHEGGKWPFFGMRQTRFYPIAAPQFERMLNYSRDSWRQERRVALKGLVPHLTRRPGAC